LLVHFSIDEVSSRTVVAGVEFGKPSSLFVFSHTAANLVGVGPNHGCVMANSCAKFERLDPFVAEQGDLLVPILDGPGPIRLGAGYALFVDVQILTSLESADLSTF